MATIILGMRNFSINCSDEIANVKTVGFQMPNIGLIAPINLCRTIIAMGVITFRSVLKHKSMIQSLQTYHTFLFTGVFLFSFGFTLTLTCAETIPELPLQTVQQMNQECSNRKNLSPSFCRCTIEVSKEFDGDILTWRGVIAAYSGSFDSNSEDGKDTFDIMARLIERTATDLPGLRSKNDVKTYVVGRLYLFQQSVKKKCGNPH